MMSTKIVENCALTVEKQSQVANELAGYIPNERDRLCILTLSCPDRIGIVAAVSAFLADNECNIVESAQFGDRHNGKFFLRISFLPSVFRGLQNLESSFAAVKKEFGMNAVFYKANEKTRSLIMVSKFGHCLNDLLYRHQIGGLPIDIPLVISNHPDLRDSVARQGIRFLHLPVTPETKSKQESVLRRVIQDDGIELVILARYMQVLSNEMCEHLEGRAINIHHSFLPSFKGALPYTQAYNRGVKLIGATAHYVTAHLDEGPIIEQAVERVHHGLSRSDYVDVGKDVECLVLARAVKWHVEHRVLINGSRTIVFA